MTRVGGLEYKLPPEWLRRDDDPEREHEERQVENVHTRAPFRLPHEADRERSGAEGPGLSDQNGR